MDEIKKNIYIKDILKDFEKINDHEKNSIKYNLIKNRIINVSEYVN